MLVKPFAIVILCQGFKEFEEIWCEHIRLLQISFGVVGSSRVVSDSIPHHSKGS
jgi:hypothetical protein